MCIASHPSNTPALVVVQAGAAAGASLRGGASRARSDAGGKRRLPAGACADLQRLIDVYPRGAAAADGSAQARLHFSALRLPASHCLAGAPRAGQLLRGMLDRGTVAASAELVGLMDRALEMTLDYLRTRRQFGKPIGSFQALQHRAVDIWIQRQLARAAVDAAVRTLDSPTSTAAARQLAASSAKSRASHAALMLCTQAVQLHGAIGFTDEYDLGLYLNRALNLSAWLGNAAEHRRRYGALAQLPAASAT